MDERRRRRVRAEREASAGVEICSAIANSGFRFVRGATMRRSEHKNWRKIRSALDTHGAGNCGGPEKAVSGQSGSGEDDNTAGQRRDGGGIANWCPARKNCCRLEG